MVANEQLAVLLDVCRRLDEATVSYMLCGSVALNYYASPRMARDIDVVVELKTDQIKKFNKIFAKDYYFQRATIRDAITQNGTFSVLNLAYVVKIDFIIRSETEYRRLAFERRRTVKLFGSSFKIASPEDLLLSKLVWACGSKSELELSDIRNLASVRAMDWDFIRHWAKALGVDRVYRSFLEIKSGVHRLQMGCELFSIVRATATARMPEESLGEGKERLFLWLYAEDFSELDRQKIARALRAVSANSSHTLPVGKLVDV